MRVNDVKTNAARSRRRDGCLLDVIGATRLLRAIDLPRNFAEFLARATAL
jgi:hypothetical protein